jgi:hypothetical protein
MSDLCLAPVDALFFGALPRAFGALAVAVRWG